MITKINDRFTDNSVDFKIHAENQDGSLIIENIKQKNFFISTSQKLMQDKNLLNKFSKNDIAFIRLFVGMAIAETKK